MDSHDSDPNKSDFEFFFPEECDDDVSQPEPVRPTPDFVSHRVASTTTMTFAEAPAIAFAPMEEEDRVLQDFSDLSFNDPMTPSLDPDTQEMPTPTSGASDRCTRKLPPRSESSMTEFYRRFDDDATASESPSKFSRPNESSGLSSRSFANFAAPRRLRRGVHHHSPLSMLGAASKSTSALPTPHVDLLKDIGGGKKYCDAVFDGLTLPVRREDGAYYINHETAFRIITKVIKLPDGFELLIWDARFPHEFEGGHIQGAKNFGACKIRAQVDEEVRKARSQNKKFVVLCYCQYSSRRAPKLHDILYAAEKDIQLLERENTMVLQSEEKSRFHVFVVDGGYNEFFKNHSDVCNPMGYVGEYDDPVRGPMYRSQYDKDVEDACSSRVLLPSPGSQLKKSKSFMETRRRFLVPSAPRPGGLRLSYCGVSDDDDDEEFSPRLQNSLRARSINFDTEL